MKMLKTSAIVFSLFAFLNPSLRIVLLVSLRVAAVGNSCSEVWTNTFLHWLRWSLSFVHSRNEQASLKISQQSALSPWYVKCFSLQGKSCLGNEERLWSCVSSTVSSKVFCLTMLLKLNFILQKLSLYHLTCFSNISLRRRWYSQVIKHMISTLANFMREGTAILSATKLWCEEDHWSKRWKQKSYKQ